MAIMDMRGADLRPRRFSSSVLHSFATFTLFLAADVHATVQFEPIISIGIARTDNVMLAAENEQAETVYQVIPAFTLTQQAPRLTSNAAYRLEGYYYNERGDSQINHLFDGNMSAALDPQNFFIELGASRDQSIRDPQAPIPHGNLLGTGNLVDRDYAYLGPAFQYSIGANTTVRGNYRRGWIRYDESPVPGEFRRNFDEDTTTFSIDNYRKRRGLTWAARYSDQKTDYGLALPWEFRQAAVELGAWTGEQMRVFATGGKESAWDLPFDPSLRDRFWEAGLERGIGERFRAELAAGERTFGSSRRALISFMFRRGQTQLTYTELPTTQERNPFRSGLLEPQAPEDLLARPGRGERYISKRLQWNLGLTLRRTNFNFILFNESREDRTTIDGTQLVDIEQTGAYFDVSWRLGAKTDLAFSLRHNQRDFEVDERDLTTAALTANRSIGPRTQLSLEYAYREEESVLDGPARDTGYEVNIVSLLLTRSF